MNFLDVLTGHSDVAAGLAVLSLAVALGLVLGNLRVAGIRLGVAGVLFVALVFGQSGLTLNATVLQFLEDFSLIIFVYAIGLQVGPGFLASFRSDGIRLNVLALSCIGLGALLAMSFIVLFHLPRTAAAGVFCGAFTTTPGLGAAQDALRQALAARHDQARAAIELTGLAYAVTYPIGVVGPNLVMITLRKMFGVSIERERLQYAAHQESRRPKIETADIEVTAASAAGMRLKDHAQLKGRELMLSRLIRNGVVSVPNGETLVTVGDVYRAIGPARELEALVEAIGRRAQVDFSTLDGDVKREEMVVTRTHVLRRPLRDLNLTGRTGVRIGKITRAGVDVMPSGSLSLHFGDRVTAVGPEKGLELLSTELGNKPDLLNYTQVIPIFVGIVLGVIVGGIPLTVPGLQTPMRIGLAGGPMIVAIALSQLGNVGSLVWYMPAAANQLFRDFGLAVFLACVGLQSGDNLVQKIVGGHGLAFICIGAAATIVPVFLIAIVARAWLKMNFVVLAGWVAGAMTSLPGLLFANEFTGSDAPALVYAAVAPLAMLGPIVCAQLLVIGMA